VGGEQHVSGRRRQRCGRFSLCHRPQITPLTRTGRAAERGHPSDSSAWPLTNRRVITDSARTAELLRHTGTGACYSHPRGS
jgi:hypothetical protein